MNILELLEDLEWPMIYGESSSSDGPMCLCCGTDTKPTHNESCELKAYIDALRSGRLVVVDKSIDDNRRAPKGFQRIEAYTDFETVVIMGDPYLLDGDNHNCDAMGCGSTGHVMARLPIIKEKEQGNE